MPDDPRVRQLLDELLDGEATPEEVCGGCSELLPVVRARWRRLCRARAEVDALFPSETGPDGRELPDPPEVLALPAIPGYEVEAVVGRGGMGVVFRARHLRLNRLVAVKMLLAGPHAGPRERERFRREAEAVAALCHPNVVQVYDVGDAGGRPYFTMEYLDGGSLAQKTAGTPLPGRDAAALVADLAGAVEAAHRAGIVHRDLKPANVLVSADGVTKVCDFGVARRVGDEAALTGTGAAVGTPGYMAPEQARGRAAEVGPATDVYALGAILYELLTGRPPFLAESAAETLRQVVDENPAHPSRLNRSVPRALETVCLKCLRKQPGHRYPSARALADDLGRFLRGEPVAARPVGTAEAVWNRAKRSPAAAGLLVAVGLLGAAGAAGAALLYQHQAAARAHQAQTDREVGGHLARARVLLADGWRAADLEKLKDAEAEGKQAEGIAHSGEASTGVRQEAEAFAGDAAGRLHRARKTHALLRALLDVSSPWETGGYVRDEAGRVLAQPSVDDQYAAAFRAWALDVDAAPEAEVVARLAEEPDGVVQELIAALDNWMLERRLRRADAGWQRLLRVAEQVDRNEQRRRLRVLLVATAPPRADGVAALVGAGSPWPVLAELARGNIRPQLHRIRQEIDPRTEPVLTVVLLAQALAAAGDTAGAEQVLVRAVAAHPDQVVLLDLLGRHLEKQGPARLEEAIGYYRAVRARRRDLGISLGTALARAGRAAQAEGVLQELVRQQPGHPAPWFHLGRTLEGRQKYDEAETAYRRAIDLKPDLAEAHHNLGGVLDARQRPHEAEAAYRRAIECKPGLAEAHVNLGNCLVRAGKYAEGEAAYRRAIALRPGLAEAHNNLGNSLCARRQFGEAEAAFRTAVALDPARAAAHSNLSTALTGLRKYAPAAAASRKALELDPDLAPGYFTLGNALAGLGKRGEAVAAWRTAVALQPGNPEAHYYLGNGLREIGRGREAEAAYRAVIALEPGHAQAHTNLGSVLLARGRGDDAEAAWRTAIAHKPDLTEPHMHLGLRFRDRFQFAEAAAAFAAAAAYLPDDSALRDQARRYHRQCARFAALDARLPALLGGTETPAGGAERVAFAELCHFKRHYATAARLYRDAFAAEPGLADAVPTFARYNAACGAALARCGRGADAGSLDEAGRAAWGRQALAWLRQDLEWWSRTLDGGDARARAQVQQKMRHWQADPDLAGVRGVLALARLPGGECEQWTRLWSDVAALLRRAGEPE
ncbi:tetratricopeptide repeat protein [bacterium]|nr:tetratricopeptide repeat protein [bacterium]